MGFTEADQGYGKRLRHPQQGDPLVHAHVLVANHRHNDLGRPEHDEDKHIGCVAFEKPQALHRVELRCQKSEPLVDVKQRHTCHNQLQHGEDKLDHHRRVVKRLVVLPTKLVFSVDDWTHRVVRKVNDGHCSRRGGCVQNVPPHHVFCAVPRVLELQNQVHTPRTIPGDGKCFKERHPHHGGHAIIVKDVHRPRLRVRIWVYQPRHTAHHEPEGQEKVANGNEKNDAGRVGARLGHGNVHRDNTQCTGNADDRECKLKRVEIHGWTEHPSSTTAVNKSVVSLSVHYNSKLSPAQHQLSCCAVIGVACFRRWLCFTGSRFHSSKSRR
eukprot:m.238033 g.238033  ORF g.238033 m.238033 type:complete len:326 (-) comp18963_c0_seq5:486-1463(-)